jgi:hypothetical protein
MNDGPQIKTLPDWLRWLVLPAGIAAGLICLRASFDLSRFNHLFLLPLWIFLLVSLAPLAVNLLAAFRGPQTTFRAGPWSRAALIAVIPVAFLASGLDCMGLSLKGCTSVCNFLVRIWTPFVAVTAAVYMVTARRWLLPLITLVCLGYLVPSCRCYNPVNAWWLHRFASSPACFAASLWASVIAIAALCWGRQVPLAIAVCWVINAALLGFFVGHHYYHFPW